MMEILMKSKKCRACKSTIRYKGRGRYPKFCSAACRQRAYWKRVKSPFAQMPVRLLQKDIDHMHARTRLVHALERLGYAVTLTRVGNPQTLKPPALHIVKTDAGEEKQLT